MDEDDRFGYGMAGGFEASLGVVRVACAVGGRARLWILLVSSYQALFAVEWGWLRMGQPARFR